MIRVLVVEDDKLARKGLVHAMPWADYGMTVVGEASNGRNALDFLGSHDVDLMLTDFAMPGMTGGDLMRAARERFPSLRFVVLTFHQELEYAQEAFRAGALDYIAKIQLDKEGFDEVLGRIRGRYLEDRRRSLSAPANDGEYLESETVFALVSAGESQDPRWLAALGTRGASRPVELETGLWWWEPRGIDRDEERARLAREIDARPGWNLIELSGLCGESRGRVQTALRKYRRSGFFYDGRRGPKIVSRRLDEIDPASSDTSAEGRAGGGEAALEARGRELLALEWVFDDEAYERLKNSLRAARAPIQRLLRLLVELEAEWNRAFYPSLAREARLPDDFDYWADVEAWLGGLRESASAGSQRLAYAKSVRGAVMKAVKIVGEELGGPLFAVDVARRVNMSRGYFSRCFKDITGKPFNDFLQGARAEKAKLLLIRTEAQVSQIAEQVGYADEKYFAKVFREQAGLSPTAFRQAAREGRLPYSAG